QQLRPHKFGRDGQSDDSHDEEIADRTQQEPFRRRVFMDRIGQRHRPDRGCASYLDFWRHTTSWFNWDVRLEDFSVPDGTVRGFILRMKLIRSPTSFCERP